MRVLRRPIDDLWLVLAVALPALGALLAPLSTVDLGYQLRTGDLILSAGTLPRTDPFTFSAAGLEWVVQQWAAAVALALAFRPAGWAGLLVLRAVIVAATFALVLFPARRSGLPARDPSPDAGRTRKADRRPTIRRRCRAAPFGNVVASVGVGWFALGRGQCPGFRRRVACAAL